MTVPFSVKKRYIDWKLSNQIGKVSLKLEIIENWVPLKLKDFKKEMRKSIAYQQKYNDSCAENTYIMV